jgi:peptide/nickel transport system permease protein
MVSLGIITAYLLLVGFIYTAELFDCQFELIKWDTKVGSEYEPPGAENVFGTDFLGRSVLRKALYGAKVSITVAFWASVISLVIGVPLGAIAGYFRGFIDEIIVWLYTTLSSIPYILLILAFALVLKGKTINLEWAGLGTIELEREYILAAKSYGCSNSRIIFKHLIPNVFHLVIISFSLRFVSFIQAEVILSFLGLGEKNRPSWGAMIDTARLDLPKGYWWEMTAATVGIFFISLALNIFGDALRDALDPKLRVQ